MYCRGESSAAVTRCRSELRLTSGSVKSVTGEVWAHAAVGTVKARPAIQRESLMDSAYPKPGALSSKYPVGENGAAIRPAGMTSVTSAPRRAVLTLHSVPVLRLKKPRAAPAEVNTVPPPMNAPAQVFAALVVVGAVSFLPLGTRFQEADILAEKIDKRAFAQRATDAALTASRTAAAQQDPAAGGGAAERIPAGVSAAVASATIAEIQALDGKMLSSRRIVELLDKLMQLPESHMEEARAAIEQSKNMVLTGFLASALYSRWGELNPEAAKIALQDASKSGNPVFKFAGAAALAGGWMEKDPDAFIKWVTEKPEGEDRVSEEMRRVMMDSALAGMANIDSATAEKLIAAAPKERRAWMIMDMAEHNPNIDPKDAAARALAEAGEDNGQRSSIHWRLARNLADKDPQEAFKYAETLPENERGNYYQAGFESWMKKDKAEAMKWITSQPENVQTNAVRGMRGEFDDMSYAETMKFAEQLGGKASEEVWFSALNEKARDEPQAALEYLPNVPEDRRHFSYNEIANEWTKKDPEAASEWIYDLEAGKEKDHAIQGMVQELKGKEPDSSTIWASTITDEGMRNRLVTESAKVWLRRDRDAATEWINNSETLSEELKNKLLPPP
jgi:hypothetical protein